MNDWDNFDNFPEDDDNDFDWLNDNDDEQSEDASNDSWGDLGDLDDLWGEDAADEDTSDSDNLWGIEADDDGNGIDDVDAFLFASTDDADDEIDDFLLGTSTDDDSVDDFLLASSSDDDVDADDFLFGTASDDNSDELDDFLLNTSSDEDSDDFLFGVPADESDDSTDFGDWGDLDDSNIFSQDAPQSTASDDDLGVPDWLADMPESGDEAPIDETPDWLADMPLPDADDDQVIEATADDAPDWLSDMPVPGESAPAFDVDALEDDWLGDVAGTDELQSNDDLGTPDWLLDVDDDDLAESASDDDMLDIFSELDNEPIAEASSDDDLLSIFDDLEDDTEIVAESDDELLDLLNDFGDGDSQELGDLLASLDTDDDDGDLDDLLASLDGDSTEEADLDDLFASLEDETVDESLDADFAFSDVVDADNQSAFLESDAQTADDGYLDDLFGEEDAVANDLDFFDEVAEPDNSLDFFDELEAEAVDDLDFFSELEAEDANDLDFFNELDTEDAVADDLDFFDEVSTLDETFEAEDDVFIEDTADLDFIDADEDAEQIVNRNTEPIAEPTKDMSWLDDIAEVDGSTFDEAMPVQSEPVDLDALIDSFDVSDNVIEDDDDSILEPVTDLDSFFDQLDQEDLEPTSQADTAVPEWLASLQEQGTGESAANLLRDRDNRSLDELDDRLLDLRDRGLELSSSTSETDDEPVAPQPEKLSKIIPNIDEALVPARFKTDEYGAVTIQPNITPEQAQRAALLQGLVGSSLGTDGETGTSSNAGATVVQSIIKRADRVVIALLLLAAVIVPFTYADFAGLGLLPANEFATDSPEFAAFELIENLNPNDYVLIGAEYGASGARELDTATRSLMEHIIINGGIPVIVSSDAIGLLRAENIAVDLLGEDVRNAGYFVVGLLPGGNVGLRDFSQNFNVVVGTDITGQTIDLRAESLDDFASIILISESGERVRNWMEQIAPVTDTEIIVVTSQSARPIALPYVSSVDNVVAMLTSYEDAYTYQQMSLALYNPSETPIPSPTLEASPIPTETLTPTETPVPTESEDDSADDEETVPLVDEEDDATEEVEESDTQSAEEEDESEVEPTATNTVQASDTPVPSNTPQPTATATPALIEVGTIIADGRVNVRSGPSSDFPTVAGLDPNSRVRVIGRSDDGEWVNVVLPNGGEGWLAIFLIDIEEIPDDEWDGASKDSFFPVYFSRPPEVRQGDDSDTVLVGRNASGITVTVYSDEDLTEELTDIANGAEFIVIEEGEPATQILLADGQIAFIETRLIVINERPRDEVDFAPTLTPTFTPTVTLTPSPTLTVTPILPEITPAPFVNPETRSSSQVLGLLGAIVVIALGNIYWILRWLGRRDQ